MLVAWQEIFLTYIAPCHYNAIRRRTSSLPRIFALSRSTSSVEAAMKQADRQGLPRNQVTGLGSSARPVHALRRPARHELTAA